MIKINQLTIGNDNIQCGSINLILGSNNTGKSTFLREILDSLQEINIGQDRLWINGLELISQQTKTTLDEMFPEIAAAPTFDTVQDFGKTGLQNIYQGLEWNGAVFNGMKSLDNNLRNFSIIENTPRDENYYLYKFITRLKTLGEFCDTRLTGPFGTSIGEISGQYSDIIHYLFANDDLFKKISEHIAKVFNIDIVFDDLIQGTKNIRLKPLTRPNPNTMTKVEYADFWKKNSKHLAQQGDGIKAYMKIIYGLFSLSKDIILIDEPEAFLHPPQRRHLGKFIAENANQGKQIFISTHDSEFLRGVLTSSPKNLKIIHLKNVKGNYTFNINPVSPTVVSRHFNELLLNAYFTHITVLCEAEDDRMVYQYAAEKYLPDSSVEVNFVGLSGKDTVIKNFETLKKRDTNAACIFDIDVLYSGEPFRPEFITNPADLYTLNELKSLLLTLLPPTKLRTERKDFKAKGVSSKFVKSIKGDVKHGIEILAKYGFFVPDLGELEAWMKVTKKDDKKIQTMIDKINSKEYRKLKSFLSKVLSHS